MALTCDFCKLYRKALEAASARRGVKPGFEPYHVIAFLILASKGPVGRPLASKTLDLGDTATKTLMRRLKESGVIVQVGRSGVTLVDEYRDIVERMGIVVFGRCVGLDLPCGHETDVCRDLNSVLRLRDSLVSLNVRLQVIMCCSGGIVAPGVPPEYHETLVREATPCIGKSVCVLLENEATLLEAGKVVYAVLNLFCSPLPA